MPAGDTTPRQTTTSYATRIDAMTISVVNPATEETLATLPSAGIAETDAAVAAATKAFPAWRAVAPAE